MVKGEPKQLRVSTITLQPEDTNNMYAFHCLNCGNFQQQIGGKVSKIYPIYEPSDQVPVVSTCRHCMAKYTFQTYDGYSTDKIKVILHPTQSINVFYCSRGKNRILEYTARMITTIQDNERKQPPFDAQCPDINCGAMYFFSDLL